MSHYDKAIEYYSNAPLKDNIKTYVLNRLSGIYYAKQTNKSLPILEFNSDIASIIRACYSASYPEPGKPSERDVHRSIHKLCIRLRDELINKVKTKKLRVLLRHASSDAIGGITEYRPEFINYAIELLESNALDQKSLEYLIEKLFMKYCSDKAGNI